jgi:hypothetical protein
MSDPVWDARLKSFLKKTGDEFKRFSTDVKAEADRLLAEVKDPQRQRQVREGLQEVGVWARRTADEVATAVDAGLKQAEVALTKASQGVTDFVSRPTAPGPGGPPGTSTPEAAAPPAAPRSPARKSVGRASKPRRSTSSKPARKTLGKRPRGSGRPST